MLVKLSVPGRPTSLDDSRAGAYCACSRCGWGLFGHFFSHLSFLFSFSLSLEDDPDLIYLFSFLSPSLWETARYRLKYCLKGPLNPKQPTNQPRLINLYRHTPSCLASLYILSVLSVYVFSVSLKNSGNLRKLPKQGY